MTLLKEANRPAFAARVKRDYGIEIQQGPFEINTRALHILKKYADTRRIISKLCTKHSHVITLSARCTLSVMTCELSTQD